VEQGILRALAAGRLGDPAALEAAIREALRATRPVSETMPEAVAELEHVACRFPLANEVEAEEAPAESCLLAARALRHLEDARSGWEIRCSQEATMPSNLLDIFFPNPRQVVVVRSWGYEVGDLHAPGIHSLSLAQRKVQSSVIFGLRIRWRVGIREGMAFLDLDKEEISWIRAHSVRAGPTLRLPDGMEISAEKDALRVQKGTERLDIDLRARNCKLVSICSSPTGSGIWGGAWKSGNLVAGGMMANLEVLLPSHRRRYDFVVGDVLWRWGLDSPLAVGPGVLAVLISPRQIWAAHMSQGALHLIAEEERGVLKTIALSPKGRYLVALRQERDRAAWLGWRWDGRTFVSAWEAEMPPLPEEGDVRISPDLRWIVLVGSRVWAIPAPGIPVRSSRPVTGAGRKIFPVEVSHESERSS